MDEAQREILLDILGNTEALNKVSIALDPVSRSVTIVYDDIDEEWFSELQKVKHAISIETTAKKQLQDTERMALIFDHFGRIDRETMHKASELAKAVEKACANRVVT